nr:MAG TPA: Prolyl oligopeptidase family [Caudoviricetes sp.]
MIRGGQRCKQVQCVCSVRIGHGAGGLAAHMYSSDHIPKAKGMA